MSTSTIRALLATLGLATVVVVAAGCVTPRGAYVRYDYGSPYYYDTGAAYYGTRGYYGTTGYYGHPGYYGYPGYYGRGVGGYAYPRYYDRGDRVVVPQRAPVYVQPGRSYQPRVVVPPHQGGVRVTPPPGYRGGGVRVTPPRPR